MAGDASASSATSGGRAILLIIIIIRCAEEDALIDAVEEKVEAARLLGNAEAERAIQSLSPSRR